MTRFRFWLAWKILPRRWVVLPRPKCLGWSGYVQDDVYRPLDLPDLDA